MILGILLALLAVDPGDIGKVNAAKSEAKKAYLAGDYKAAAVKYQYLVDSAGVTEDEVLMNLANSYFNLNDTTQALGSYQRVTQSTNNNLKSRAFQQMGVLNNREGKFEEALASLKLALKADPTNDDARFNYEMIKKKLEEEKKKQQQDQNKEDQDKKDQNKDSNEEEKKDQKDQKDSDKKKEQEQKDQEKKDQEKKDKEQQQKEQEEKEQQEKDSKELPPSVKDKLKDMNMSEEKAKMILEAMKAQEIQYLQQNKRKATKPKDKAKPDW